MDFIDAWKVAVKSKMFILIPFLFFFVFGVKVYLSFFFFSFGVGYVTQIMYEV